MDGSPASRCRALAALDLLLNESAIVVSNTVKSFRTMRFLPILALCVLLILPASRLSAADSPPMTPEFREKVIEAIKAFHERDLEKATAKIAEAEKIQPGTTATANLRGAIALQSGNYAQAAKYFQRALEIDSSFYPAKFNLGEIEFRQKKYSEARVIFEKLLAENKDDELAQYKVFLTYLLQSDEKKAQEVLDAMKFPSNTPAYYYAHAAWEYSHRNTKEAASWVQSSARIFPPHVNLIYAETLEDLGWLKRKETGTDQTAEN